MPEKISLIFGSHAHVPYGADPSEFEKVYTGLLKPFISALYKYPRIQAALHYSGVLLHWVERSHPELFMLIEDMMARKQIEMLGGGFYEPMLPIIPLQDKIGQIELLTTYLRKQFGKRPQGCWIPSFAWEQGLVSPLVSCGMGFTFLGERQFALSAAGSIAPCICEDQGKLITVFPVLQPPESVFAGKNISAFLQTVRETLDNQDSPGAEHIVSLFPEKINSGRGETNDSAWNRFFEELSLCESFVETVLPGKLAKSLKGLQKRYFPDSADTAESISSRRFIIVHPEAGGIYAKMVFTNVLINQLRGDKSRKLSAHEELWKAQDSAIFCKTGSHGLHNHLLRNAAYSALLRAEQVTREKGRFSPSLVPFDFNMDGAAEWLFQDARINCYVQSLGGGVFELDYLPKVWNYLASCGGRFAFADRLLPLASKAENLASGDISGARPCGRERYEADDMDKVRRKLRLALRPASSGPFADIEIQKTYLLKKDTVCVGYSFINRGTARETFQFAPEIDLALPGEGGAFSEGDAFVRFFACKSATAEKPAAAEKTAQTDVPLTQPILHGADGLKIHDIKNEVQILFSANHSFDAKISPIHISADEKLYQAHCIMPLFPISLDPGGKQDLELTLKFSH